MAIHAKSYMKNLMRSFGFVGSEIAKDKVPNIIRTASTIKETTGDANRFMREQRVSLRRTVNSFNRDSSLKEGSNIMKDIKSDLMTGKFYEKFRDDGLDEDIDFDNIDVMFDDIEDPDLRNAKIENTRAKLASHENRQNSEMISKTIIGSTNAALAQHRAINTLFYSQTLTNFNVVTTNLKSMNDNMVNNLAEIRAMQKAQLDNASTYYAESLDIQRKLLKTLETMQPPETKRKKKLMNRDYGVDKISTFGEFDAKKYKKNVVENFSNLFFDPTMVTAPLEILKEFKNGNQGRVIDNPLGFIPKTIINSLIPKNISKDLEKLDSMFEDILSVGMRRLNRVKSETVGLPSMLAELLGVNNDIIKDSKQFRKYEKGRVSWDGKSKKALEEVIPGYLSQIAAVLTGSEPKLYDYESATFKTLDKIRTDQINQMSYYSKTAYNTVSGGVDTILGRMDISNNERKKMDEKINEVYNYLFKSDKLLTKDSIDELKNEGIGSDAIYELFEKVLNSKTGLDKNVDKIKSAANIEKAKRDYNRSISTDYNNVNNWLLNNMYEKNGKNGYSPSTTMSILEVKDKNNNTIFDYVRQIAENTSGYNRYSRRIGDSNINNYNTTIRSRRSRQTSSSGSNTRQIHRSSSDSKEAALSDLDDHVINQLGQLDVKNLFNDDGIGWNFDTSLKIGKKVQDKIEKSPVGRIITNASVIVSSMLEKILVGSDSGKSQSLTETLRDIFDNPNSQFGKFLDEVEKANADKDHQFRTMASVAGKKVKDSFTGSYKFQTAKSFFNDVKDELYFMGSSAKDSIKDSVISVKNDIKDRWESEDSLLGAIRRGIFRGDVEHFAAGGEAKRHRKSKHRRGFETSRPIVSVLSEGEIVLTPEEAKEYKRLKSKRNIGETFTDEEEKLYKKGKASDRYKERQGYSSNNPFEKILKSFKVDQMYDDLMNSLFGVANAKENKQDKDGESKFFKVRKEIFDTFKKHTASMTASGIVGALGATALGVIGGPLTGIAAGIGINLVKKSDNLQKLLFGDLENNKEGLVPKKFVSGFHKYFPDMKKYGITSGLLGALPITPFGPIGGIMLGSAIGFMKNNQTVQNELFGTQGLLGPKAKELLLKNSRKMLGGAALGALTGPFGLVGNAILGSSIAVITTTDNFKKGLLGEKDEHGIYQHGVLPSLRDKVVFPLRDFALEVPKKAKEFLREEIAKPLKEAVKPIGSAIKGLVKPVVRKITDLIVSGFKQYVHTPMYKKLEKYMIDPIKKAASRTFGAFTGALKKTLLAPVRLVSNIGTRVKNRQLEKGKAADYMTAGERLNYIGIRGLKVNDDVLNLDKTLQKADNNTLEDILEQTKLADAMMNSRDSAKFKKYRENSGKIATSSDKLTPADLRSLNKFLKKENSTGDTTKYSDEAFNKLLSDIGIKRKMSVDEFNKFKKEALKHRSTVSKMEKGQLEFNKDQKELLNKVLGTKNIEKNMKLYDVIARAEYELKNRKSLSYVNEKGEVVEPTKDQLAKQDLDNVMKSMPKYQNNVVDKLQSIINILSGKTIGITPFDISSKQYNRSLNNIGIGLDDEYLSSMENPDEVINKYRNITNSVFSRAHSKNNAREKSSIVQTLYRGGVRGVTGVANSFDKMNYYYGNKRFGDPASSFAQRMNRYDYILNFKKESEKDAKYEKTEYGKLRYIWNPASNEYILDPIDKETIETQKRMKEAKDPSSSSKEFKGKSKKTSFFDIIGDKISKILVPNSKSEKFENFTNVESIADTIKSASNGKKNKIDEIIEKYSDIKSKVSEQANKFKDTAKAHYEYTKNGVLKYIINDRGGRELDNQDSETRQTLMKDEKERQEDTKKNATTNVADKKKSEDDGAKKKKGILSKILGGLGFFGGLAKGAFGKLFGGISKGLGIGKAAGGGSGMIGLLAGGGKLLTSPLGILALIFMAPYLTEHVLPWVEKNFDNKILPFVTQKAIPATVEIVTKVAPMIAKVIFEGAKAAIPALLSSVPKMVKNLVTGDTGRNLVDSAVNIQDGQLEMGEDGEYHVSTTGNLSNDPNDRYYSHHNDKTGAKMAVRSALAGTVVGGNRVTKAEALRLATKRQKGIYKDKILGTTARKEALEKGVEGAENLTKREKLYGALQKGKKSFAKKHKIMYGAGKLVKDAYTLPSKALQIPGTLLHSAKGHRFEAVKEIFTDSIAKEHMNSNVKGFKNLLKDSQRAAEMRNMHLKGGLDSLSTTSIMDKVANKMSQIITKIVHLPFIRSVVPKSIIASLERGGIQSISSELAAAMSKKLASTAGESAAKSVAKGATRTTLRGVSAFLSLGATQIAFAVYDAWDGWHNAAKYLQIGEDQRDQISLGMKFTSAIFKVLSGLFIVTSLIPPEAWLNIYMKTVSKVFGEDTFYNTKKLQDETKRRLSQYNKTHPHAKITQKQYDQKVKDGEIDKNGNEVKKKGGHKVLSGFGHLIDKARNAVGKAFSWIFGGDRKGKAKDRYSKMAFAAGKGFDDAGGFGKDIGDVDFDLTKDRQFRRMVAFESAGGFSKDKPSLRKNDKARFGGSYYSQSDTRWGSKKIGDTNMRDAGCGPTSLAMALSDTTGKKFTPDKIASDNKENIPGYSTWGLFPSVARKYNLGYNRVAPNGKDLIENLKHGEVVLSGMRSNSTDPSRSPFTNAGHIVVAKGVDNGKIQIADPRGRSYNKSYNIDDVLNDMTLGFRYSNQKAGSGPDITPMTGQAGTGPLESIQNIFSSIGGNKKKDDKKSTKKIEASNKAGEKESSKETPGVKLGDKVVAFAKEMQKYVTYSYGADSFKVRGPSTGDCSSFTKFIFKEAAGVQLPRSSGGQKGAGKAIDISQVGSGDLACYDGHVGIFMDNKGNVIHNSMPGTNVTTGTYKQAGNGKQVYPRRVLPDDQIGAGGVTSSGVGESGSSSSSGETVATDSGGDPFGTFFGKIGGAFSKATADLFGLKTADADQASDSGSASSNTDTNAENSTQDPGPPGEKMKLNRPDNTTAAQIEAYIRQKGATSDWTGQMFKDAQAATGISPVDILVWAALESNWGKSRIARTKHNYFGIGAIDTNPMGGAHTFTAKDGIVEGAKWINKHYVRSKYKQDNWYDCFKGPTHRYSTTPSESNALTGMREKFYSWVKSAGKGPDEKSAKYFNDMFGIGKEKHKNNFEDIFGDYDDAGGADDKKKDSGGSKYPDNLNGFPYYSQQDPRWNTGGMNMTWTGCGPTSSAMVATAVSGKRITPYDAGKAAIKHGQWNGNNASSHSIYATLGKEFGFGVSHNKSNNEFFSNADKKIVQFAVGTGASPFTSGGHYVVALGTNSDGKIVTNNPISPATSQAFDKSRYKVTRQSWAVLKDGKPFTWDGHSEVSGGNAGGTDMGMTKEESKKVAGASEDPFSTFFGKIGGAFAKATADLFGLKTAEAAAPQEGNANSDSGSSDGNSINKFKDAVVSTFQDSTVSWGRGGVGDNVVAAHNMTFGTKVSIPRFKGKAGGGKFNAGDGKTYDLGPEKNGVFMVADNGGPFFDFDVHTSENWKGNTDVDVIEWGTGPKTWTLTQAIQNAKGSKYGGNFYTHNRAFREVFTKYGGFKTADLTKFGTEDKNNPDLHPSAGTGGDIGELVTKAVRGYTEAGKNQPNKYPLTPAKLGETSKPSVLDRFFNSTLDAKKSSGFGARDVAGFGNFHTGVDYDTFGKSKPILSPVEGKVVRTLYSKDTGRSVVIKDWFGNTHHFDHLSSKNVNPGQIVQAYDPIGKVGDTGELAKGKHLHYEIMDGKNQSMDPDEYLKMYGAFGGKQNTKVNAEIDKNVFNDINKDIIKATRGDNSYQNHMYKVFEAILKAMLSLLSSINVNSQSTANTVMAIVNILNKYSDKLPTEAKSEISKLNEFSKTLGTMMTAPTIDAVNAKKSDSHIINSDIREVVNLMNHLGTE